MNGTISRLRFQCMNIRDRLSNAVHTPWLLTKTVLRGITALLALISLSFFAAAIPSWNRNLVHINGPDKGDWQDGIPIAPLALAVIYNAFTTTYALKTGKRVPYHILEVLIDFLICSVLAAALVFATWGGVFNVWETATTTADSSGSMVMCDDESSNAFSRECFPELYPLGLIEIAAIGFAVPVWIFHVFLFVHGLVERCTRSRRVNSQATEMIKSLEADDGMNNMPRESYSYR